MSLFSEDMVSLDLRSTTAEGAIRELAALIEAQGRLNDADTYVAAVLAREAVGPTGMEMGIAIPHGKSPAVAEAAVAVGRSPGIDFGASDGTEARMIFLIAAPDNEENVHLKILAQLARRLIHEEFRTRLEEAATPDAVIGVIDQEVTL